MNNKADILNELKGLSPILLQLKENEKSVRVPNNYFEQLEDVVIAEIKAEGSILSSIKKEKIEVPSIYFDTLADTIISKIKAEEQTIEQGKIVAPQTPKRNNVIQLFSRFAAAASLIGIIAFGIQQLNKSTLPVNNCADGIACLTQDEIYNYMNVNSHDFDVQQIQETVKPALEKTEPQIDINKKEATQYIEENKNILDVEDASTDIF